MSKPAELRGPDWLRQTGRFRAAERSPENQHGDEPPRPGRHHIHELLYDSGGWHHTDLTVAAAAPPAARRQGRAEGASGMRVDLTSARSDARMRRERAIGSRCYGRKERKAPCDKGCQQQEGRAEARHASEEGRQPRNRGQPRRGGTAPVPVR